MDNQFTSIASGLNLSGFKEAELLQKSKSAQVGEIRDWKGVKMQKQPNGEWKPFNQKSSEISKMSAQGIKNAIMGLNHTATTVKDKGDYFSIEFDENDWNTHGERSSQIDRIGKFLSQMTSHGLKSIEFKDKVHTMNVYKDSVPSESEGLKQQIKDWNEELHSFMDDIYENHYKWSNQLEYGGYYDKEEDQFKMYFRKKHDHNAEQVEFDMWSDSPEKVADMLSNYEWENDIADWKHKD